MKLLKDIVELILLLLTAVIALVIRWGIPVLIIVGILKLLGVV